MARIERAEKISITLPPEMLSTIKTQVQNGAYSTTSEVIREALREWQQRQQERQARLALIQQRLEQSAQSGTTLSSEEVWDALKTHHLHHSRDNNATL